MGCGNNKGKVVQPVANPPKDHKLLKSVTVKAEMFAKLRKDDYRKFYIKNKLLGEGGYGQVFLAKHTTQKKTYALKIINQADLDIECIEQLYKEIENTRMLDHFSIAKIKEGYDESDNLIIIYEYINGSDLIELVEKGGPVPENEAKIIIREILVAINYAHSQGCVHRDIKLDNVMIESIHDASGSIKKNYKVIDWGSSHFFQDAMNRQLMIEEVGTYQYMAPEVIKKSYDQRCDIWSIGVLLYILFCGEFPFYNKNNRVMVQQILKGNISFNLPGFNLVSNEAKQFVSYMMTYDYKKRPTAKECLNHKWLNQTDKVKPISQTAEETKLKFEVSSSLLETKNRKKLTQVVIQYLTINTCTESEKAEMMKCFALMDKNSDGVISQSEIVEEFSVRYGNTVQKEQIEKMMEKIDLDQNNEISYSEFIGAMIGEKLLKSKENLKMAFAAFDTNGNHEIQYEEFQELFENNQEVKGNNQNREVWNQFIQAGDQKGKQTLNQQEFFAMMETIITQRSIKGN